MTASAAQLAQYGFPPRPTGDPAAMQQWSMAMAHAITYVAPHPVCTSVTHGIASAAPPPSVNETSNYAGHVMANTYENGADFTSVEANWTQPSVSSASGYPNYKTAPDASFWTGLGYSNILQAGCDSISTSNSPTYKCWTEDYPNGTDWEGPTIHPGDAIYVSVTYNGNHTTSYYIANNTTNQYSKFTNASPYVGSEAGDFINESLGPYLPAYGNMTFSECIVLAGTKAYGLRSDNNNVDENVSSPGAMPGPVNDADASFTDTWEAH